MQLFDPVWVGLTNRGLKHLEDRYQRVQWTGPILAADANGWYEMPLGDLMRIFGPICNDGHATPFKDNTIHTSRPTKPSPP